MTKKPAEKLSRMDAAYRAIQGLETNGATDTLSHLAKVADDLYVSGGGKSDLEAASAKVEQVIEHLGNLGLVRYEWEMIITPLVSLANIRPSH